MNDTRSIINRDLKKKKDNFEMSQYNENFFQSKKSFMVHI